MADLTGSTFLPVATGNNDGLGGGGFGGLMTGMLMSTLFRNGGLGGDAAGSGIGTNQILQSMAQQQANNALVNVVQDVNRVSHDVATSSAATQAAVGASTLQQAIASLQGQNALGKDIADTTVSNMQGHTNILGQVSASAADTNAQINNSANRISGDIRDALGVIDADLHGMGAQIDNSIARTRDDINRAHYDLINAAHNAEVQGLRSSYDTLRAITESNHETFKAIKNDGDQTRSLIYSNALSERDRQIVIAENKLAEALSDHRHTRSTNDIIINNNNNNNNLLSAMQTQQQQQQMAGLVTGLSSAIAGIHNLTQVSLINGSGSSAVQGARQS